MSHFYISDLDGTLLDRRAEVSPAGIERLNRLLAEGLEFTVASARGVPAMQQVLAGLRLKLPVIGFNGAFISDFATGRHETVYAIDPDIAAELNHLMNGSNGVPFLATCNGREDCVYYGEPQNEGASYYIRDRIAHEDRRLRPLTDLPRALSEQVVCLTSIGLHDSLVELAATIDQLFHAAVEIHLFENQYSPGWYWLTVHDRRATKDQAARELIRLHGLEQKPLIAFGDEKNDLKLFDLAHEAVAVANAVPEILAKAHRVIGHHDDGAVIDYIEQHWADGGRAAARPR